MRLILYYLRGIVLAATVRVQEWCLPGVSLRPCPATARDLFDVWCREMGAGMPDVAWTRLDVHRAWYAVAVRAAGGSSHGR